MNAPRAMPAFKVGSLARSSTRATFRVTAVAFTPVPGTTLAKVPQLAAESVFPNTPADGEAQGGGQFHGAVEVDDIGVDAAAGVMAAGDVGIFGGHADARPGGRVVAAGGGRGLGDGDAAGADAEVERGVDLGIVEFHQHVGTGDADLTGTEGDEGGGGAGDKLGELLEP